MSGDSSKNLSLKIGTRKSQVSIMTLVSYFFGWKNRNRFSAMEVASMNGSSTVLEHAQYFVKHERMLNVF